MYSSDGYWERGKITSDFSPFSFAHLTFDGATFERLISIYIKEDKDKDKLSVG